MGIPSNNSDVVYSNALFLLDDDNYYLKSKNYIETEYIKIGGYNTYKQPDNPIVDISSIVAIDNNGNVYRTNGSSLQGIYIFPASHGTQIGTDINGEPIYNSQTNEQVKQSYIASLEPNLKATTQKAGFKLDLNNSIINGYDLYLQGTNSSTNETFILDSGAPEIPFRIGSKFKVGWDGTLTCNKINALSNDGTTDNAISINENFYVTKNGSAGGSGCNFGGSFSGGFSGVGNGTFTGNGSGLTAKFGDWGTMTLDAGLTALVNWFISHVHSFDVEIDISHNHDYASNWYTSSTGSGGTHSHTYGLLNNTTDSAGSHTHTLRHIQEYSGTASVQYAYTGAPEDAMG